MIQGTFGRARGKFARQQIDDSRRHAGLAIAERLVARVCSGITVILVSIFADPAAVGRYATGLLILLLVQALGDAAVRQSGVLMASVPGGADQLRRAVTWSGLGGTGAMCAGIVLTTDGLRQAAELAPLALVPAMCASYVTGLVELQRQGRWPRIVRAQATAGTASLALSLPIFFVLPVAGATVQTLLAEVVFGLIVRVGTQASPRLDGRAERGILRTYYVPVAASNAVAWGQSQGDRLAIAVLAEPQVLGLYSFALSITRALSDAVVAGLANHLRAALSMADGVSATAAIAGRSLRICLVTTFALAGATGIGAVLVLPYLLAPSWSPAIEIIPLLAIAIPISGAVGITTVVMLDAHRSKALIGSQVLGLVAGVGVGALVAHSLLLGASAYFLRELVLLASRLWKCHDLFARGDLARLGATAIACSVIAIGLAAYTLSH